jgi:hypothetical protein
MPRRHVNVIVALVMVLLCVALLLPAVQKVREASARMKCYSNLKGWATALYGYASANNDTFPMGTIPRTELPPEQRLSWLVSVLPYIEQNEVYKQIDLTRGAGDDHNAKPTNTRLKNLICPSAGESYWKSQTPITLYVGVAGVGEDAATLPQRHPRAGVFGYDRNTKLTKEGCPDGSSNTLMLIETATNPGRWAHGGTATVRAFDQDTAPYIGPGQPFGGCHNGGWVLFGQRDHICTAAFADTSLHMFTTAIDPAVLEALATVAGKEAIPTNW